MQVDPETQRRFLEIAVELNMLDRPDAEKAETESADQGVGINQFVLQTGLLSAVQVDIVDTLSRPEDSIPGYEILDVLGHGGMGVVYRARQQNLDRIVALKTVLVSQLSNKLVVARFEKEALTIAKLQHPNIVSAFDFGQHKGRYYLSMEYVEGTDHEKYVAQNGKLDEAMAWSVARQVASGLAHAAKHNVVHRDVKPANLLVTGADDLTADGFPLVKITDFGLAILSSAEQDTRITRANMAVGSPPYMSPEQFENRDFTSSSDVYSLGVTVCHLLTGEPPFKGLSIQQIIAAQAKGESALSDSTRAAISPGSVELLQRMMQTDPQFRCDYPELLNAIDQIISSQKVSLPETMEFSQTSSTSGVQTSDNALAPTTSIDASGNERSEDRNSGGELLAEKVASPSIPWIRLSLGLLVLLAIVMLGFYVLQPGYRPGLRNLHPSESTPLYNGLNLDGWPITPIDGSWFTEEDKLESLAIAGVKGAHRRKLPKPVGDNYAISIFAWPQDGATAEIHFGLEGNSSQSRRGVLRITRNEIQVGHRQGRGGPWEPLTFLSQNTVPDTKYITINIEKQPTDWFVFCDEKYVGAIPIGDQDFIDEVHLEAIGGKVWFHEFRFTKLEPK